MALMTDLLNETLRSRVAYDLLASSTPARYVRICRAVAADPSIKQAISILNITPSELLAEAERAWRDLVGSEMRGEREIDLAVLLGILASSADQRVDTFLRNVGMFDRPPLSWVSALARFLSRQRSASSTLTIPVTGASEFVIQQSQVPRLSVRPAASGYRLYTEQDEHAVGTTSMRAA